MLVSHDTCCELCITRRRRHTRCALVTGVQTCALPISYEAIIERSPVKIFSLAGVPVLVLVYPVYSVLCFILSLSALRRPMASERFMGDLASTEERRVGQECVSKWRFRWSQYH